MEEKQSRGRERLRQLMKTGPYFDYNIIFLVISLAVIGIIMIFSITSTESAEIQDSFFGNQAMFAVAGVAVMLFVSIVPFQLYKKLTPFVVVAAVVALALVLTPLRVSSHGASRWINLGFTTLQPAEIAKIAIIFFTALLISRWGKNITHKKPVFELLFITAVLCGEILVLTKNLSSAIIVFGIAFLMFFLATPKMKWFFVTIGVVLLLAGLFVVYIRSTTSVEEIRKQSLSQEEGSYRADRIYAWLYTEELNDDLSFQVVNGLYAIGSGGLFGKGLGASDQKYILPETQNDMIFTIICEELGLFGAFLVLLMYGLLLYRIYFVAKMSRDVFGSMLAMGVFFHIGIQAVLNVAVVSNVIPNTGISLPFISYGGSSMILLMAEMGVVLNVARQIPADEPQRAARPGKGPRRIHRADGTTSTVSRT